YEIHIAHGNSSLADALTYQIQFKTAKPAYKDPNAMPLPAVGMAGGQEFFAQLTGSGAFGQTYTVTKLTNGGTPTVIAKNIAVPPPNVGPLTNAALQGFPTTPVAYEPYWLDNAP